MLEIFEIFARGGGGGSSGGGGAGGILLLPIIAVSMFLTWWYRKKRIKRAKQAQSVAQASDASWSSEKINARVSDVFYKFQKDWTDFSLDSIRHYTTQHFFDHMNLMLIAMQQMGRQNIMSQVRLDSLALMGVQDENDNELDRFDIEIRATAMDTLKEITTGKILHGTANGFMELWHFEREGSDWNLDGISQYNTSSFIRGFEPPKKGKKYREFAEKNGFFYNADFGWLLLPLHGTLFGEARFGTSDINHHVLGVYEDRVLQFFEYVPIPPDKLTFSKQMKRWLRIEKKVRNVKYTVGQITMPKNYGNIIVEPRGFFDIIGLTLRPKGMQKMGYNPAAFGKKFNVFATNEEQVTSFELLHPAYLELLVQTDFEVDIEVVGNNLYLYSDDKDAKYDVLLTLLERAYDELKR